MQLSMFTFLHGHRCLETGAMFRQNKSQKISVCEELRNDVNAGLFCCYVSTLLAGCAIISVVTNQNNHYR